MKFVLLQEDDDITVASMADTCTCKFRRNMPVILEHGTRVMDIFICNSVRITNCSILPPTIFLY